MKSTDIIVHYRILGPIIVAILLSFLGGFIVGFSGYYGTGLTSLVSATAVTIAGLWAIIGAVYELYAGIERYRDE